MCASGKHQIQYCVAVDDDDAATRDFMVSAKAEIPNLFMRYGPRPDSLGSVANDMADHWRADAYAVFADDLLCITYGWDDITAKAVEALPHGVFWWTPARDEATYVPIITEKWRAAAGCVFTDYFPFWYDDLWLHELWIFATDADPQLIDIKVVDKSVATTRMRELQFWHDFYHRTRPLRVRHAREIAERLGLPEGKIGPHLVPKLDAMAKVPEKFLTDIEKTNRADNTGTPTPSYARARARAEEMLKQVA